MNFLLVGVGVVLVIGGLARARQDRRLRNLSKGFGKGHDLDTPESKAAIAELTRRD